MATKQQFEIQFTQNDMIHITPELNQPGWSNHQAIWALNNLLKTLMEIRRIRYQLYKDENHFHVLEVDDYIYQVKSILTERIKGWVV